MIVILLGPPGVGKGTQCQRLVDRFGWSVVSTGDKLRSAMREETPLGKEAKSYIDAGHLVPDEVMIKLVREILASVRTDQGILFDGFPRTVAQAEALNALSAELELTLGCVVLLTVNDDELRRRMLGRAAEQGRSDDTPETIATRLETYRRQTEPLVNFYQQMGSLRRVDGLGTPDEVFARICEAVPAQDVG